jgi:Protein of unknown function (DUF2752)
MNRKILILLSKNLIIAQFSKTLKNRSFLYKIQLIALLVFPIVLLILPTDYFDHGQAICLSVILLDKTCIGCGITRAIQHLIHFDFKIAMEFNKLCIIILPLLIFLWYKEIRRVFAKIQENKTKSLE